MKRIGEVITELNISADTLRYYEKIHLIPPVQRNNAGVRYYSEKDISRLRFVKRAQKMHFSLEEIASLLTFRENPQQSKPQIRELAHQKLAAIECQLNELNILRNELELLTNLCQASAEDCPILNKLDALK